MADFQTWNRQVLPQGNLTTPPAAPSLAESFGQGVTDLAKAAAATADTIQQADDWYKAKKWEIVDQPKAVALVNDLQIKIAEQLPELKAKAASGLENYPDLIDDAIVAATEDALKDNPDPQFQRYVRGQMGDFRVLSVTAGIQEKTAAAVLHDANALQKLVKDRSGEVARDFSQIDSSLKLIDDSLAGSRYFTADERAELVRASKREVIQAGLKGLMQRDPDAAQKELESGRFDGILDASDKEGLVQDIKSERERKATEARIARENQAQAAQSDLAAKIKAAGQQALETGKYDKVTQDEIIKVLGKKRGKEVIADLDNARYMGQDALSIARQSLRADSQLLRTLSNVAAEHPDDSLAKMRYDNAERLIREKRKALRLDPEDYVRKTVPELGEDWQRVASHPYDTDFNLKARERSRQLQANIGVQYEGIRVLPEWLSDFYLQDITGKGGAAAIVQARKALGDDFKELLEKARRMPIAEVAMMLKEPRQQRIQEILLEINRNGGEHALEATLPAKYSASNVMRLVRDNLDPIAPSFAAQTGGSQVFQHIAGATYALALHYIETASMAPAEAADLAAREIAIDQFHPETFHGHAYRIPVGHDREMITQVLPKYTENEIDYSKVEKPRDRPDMPVDQIKASIVHNGYWTVVGDDSGLYLRFPNGEPVRIGGEPIVVKWEELERRWQPPEWEQAILTF